MPGELTVDHLRALIQAGVPSERLVRKLTRTESVRLMSLLDEPELAEKLGTVFTSAPLAPVAGRAVSAAQPLLSRLGAGATHAARARQAPLPTYVRPQIRTGRTPPNLTRRDPTEYAVPMDMKTRPSMGPAGPGGVVVEGEGVINSLGATLGSLLAALGIGTTAAQPSPRRLTERAQ